MNPLELDEVSVSYEGVRALDRVTLSVRGHELHGLIGSNGAGKTTLNDAVTGFERATGTVTLMGRRVDGWAPHRRARAGLARTFQHLELWADLSVRENLVAAAQSSGQDKAQVVRAAEMLGLMGDLDRDIDELPHGRQRLVSVARAVAQSPGLLLLDEPASGLDSDETSDLGERLLAMREHMAILLIDHDMTLVLAICDRITALDRGVVIAEGAPHDVATNDRVREAYLGGA